MSHVEIMRVSALKRFNFCCAFGLPQPATSGRVGWLAPRLCGALALGHRVYDAVLAFTLPVAEQRRLLAQF